MENSSSAVNVAEYAGGRSANRSAHTNGERPAIGNEPAIRGFEPASVAPILFMNGTAEPIRLGAAPLVCGLNRTADGGHRKDAFMAILAHELRGPLASIRHAVCLLSSQSAGTSTRQKAQALIERQVRQMAQFVDDLLDVSRLTTGHLYLQRKRIDLRTVVANSIEALQCTIDERRHRLTSALPAQPVWLLGDPCRLEQVLVNLLNNACRYTDAGGELAVHLYTQHGQAVVRVRDSGIGIAPQDLPYIFDLFRQADTAASRSSSGLGIGLALVRDLVELHGGSVTAASAGLGHGSEFIVRLPAEGVDTSSAAD